MERSLSITYDPVHITPAGRFYTIDGLAQASPGRPIQPKTTVVLGKVAGMLPRGALLLGAQSTVDRAFNPVIARPVPTSTLKLTEPEFKAPNWFPVKMFAINRLGDSVRLVLVPAQFKGTEKLGIQRRFTRMDFAVAYSDSPDKTPPVIWNLEAEVDQDVLNVSVAAADASGVERVLIAYSTDGETWQSIDLEYSTYTERWERSLAGASGRALYFVQAMDTAGNVAVGGNKGQYFGQGPEPEGIYIYLPAILKNVSRAQ